MLNRLSFKAQIAWLSTSLILLTIVILTTKYGLTMANYVDQQVKQQMRFARNVLQQNLLQQKQLLTTSASVLAADYGFKQAVATQDKKTIQSVLFNHAKRIRADLMILIDLNGDFISSATQDVHLSRNFSVLPRRNAFAQILNIKNDVYQVIVVPVKAPDVIAYAIMGFKFDKLSLEQLKELISLDITLVRQQKIFQTSFAQAIVEQLPLGRSNTLSPNLLFTSSDYFHEEISFGGSNEVKAILSVSLIKIHDSFKQWIYVILIGALIVLVIAIAFSHLLSKGITQPLQTLMDVTKEIGDGNHTIPKLQRDLPEEFNELYTSFSMMGNAIERREQEIKYQAERDLLTGLFNRSKFLKGVRQYLKKQKEVLLINFNIKGFKGLNDTIGVINGDKILIETAKRLRVFCDKCNISRQILTSRTHSDEFVVAIKISQLDELSAYITLLRDELERQYWLDGINLTLTFYYGTSNSLAHGREAEKLLRRANMAAASALKEQVDVRHYQKGEDEAHLYKLHLIDELKQALDARESPLFLNYQPKLNLKTGKVDKLEALVRWINKEGDFVNPEMFVGLAEQSGLIVPLTQWVILQVAMQLADWNCQGYQFSVSINLSAQDIQHEDFVDYLLDTLNQYGLLPSTIVLELTERDIAENEQLVCSRLTHLKSLGFEISVDDYGIGQSSLAKLKNLPVDELKIDKCFILTLDQSRQDQDIVASTVALGHNLGLRVVAEGVENKGSLDLLVSFQCDYVQGYHLSRPLGADQFIQWYIKYDSTC